MLVAGFICLIFETPKRTPTVVTYEINHLSRLVLGGMKLKVFAMRRKKLQVAYVVIVSVPVYVMYYLSF